MCGDIVITVPIDKELPVKDIDKSTLTSTLQGWLGAGIDLTECDPLNPSPMPTRLLATSFLNSLQSGDVVIGKSSATNFNAIWADSLLDITRQLNAEAGLEGSYGGFGGSVEAKFSSTEGLTEKRHMAKISFVASTADYSLTPGLNTLKTQLDVDFKTALRDWTAEELFDHYGTHLVIKIRVGGRAEYYCQTSDISSMSEQEFKAAAKASYAKAGGNIYGSASFGTVSSQKQQLVSGEERISTVGGDPGRSVQLGNEWDDWAGSIAENPAFLSFAKGGLLPIWDLAPSDARQTAIYEAYLRRVAKKLHIEILSVTSPTEEHNPDASVEVPDGYKLLGGGARVNYKAHGNLLTASYPDGPNTWRAKSKDHGWKLDDPATITVYALALYDPLDLWDVRVFSQDFRNERGMIQFKECAVAAGYVLVGGGVKAVPDPDGQPGHLLYTSQPDSGQGKWMGQAKDQLTPGTASLSVYAVGLRPNPKKLKGVELKTDVQTSRSDDSTLPKATASPPRSGEYKMVGGGASLGWPKMGQEGIWGMFLTSSYPKDSAHWEGYGRNHAHPQTGFINVHCIGLKVEDA